MATALETPVFDLRTAGARELNALLHTPGGGTIKVSHPDGAHALAVGLDGPWEVEIDGHVGYYCAGMNQRARVTVHGNAGVGLAENMMSGKVVVEGNVSGAAGATAHGGLLVIHGDAAARAGISLKGASIVVRGSVGHMSAFMAQSGSLLVCGDAGDGLGDSLYEAKLYVRGSVASLGADCIEKQVRAEHLSEIGALLSEAGITDVAADEFRRYGSARRLYKFTIDNAGSY
jgi:glutamate synthase domain-containing protein 3